jgi:hypothetical protein
MSALFFAFSLLASMSFARIRLQRPFCPCANIHTLLDKYTHHGVRETRARRRR